MYPNTLTAVNGPGHDTCDCQDGCEYMNYCGEDGPGSQKDTSMTRNTKLPEQCGPTITTPVPTSTPAPTITPVPTTTPDPGAYYPYPHMSTVMKVNCHLCICTYIYMCVYLHVCIYLCAHNTRIDFI